MSIFWYFFFADFSRFLAHINVYSATFFGSYYSNAIFLKICAFSHFHLYFWKFYCHNFFSFHSPLKWFFKISSISIQNMLNIIRLWSDSNFNNFQKKIINIHQYLIDLWHDEVYFSLGKNVQKSLFLENMWYFSENVLFLAKIGAIR